MNVETDLRVKWFCHFHENITFSAKFRYGLNDTCMSIKICF